MSARIDQRWKVAGALLAALLLAATSFALGARTTAGSGDSGPGLDLSSPQAVARSVQANIAAAVTMYIKIGDIKGESTDAAHGEWIDLQSVSHSIQRPSGSNTGATRQRSSATFGDIVCVKQLDKSTPKLMESISSGRNHATTMVELLRDVGSDAPPAVYLKIELTNVQITSYDLNGSTGAVPTESFSLNYEEIKVTYTPYDDTGKAGGKVEYSWKVEEGTV
ncbi:MAG TPA: type VI secretion system tube protein Hcp [Nitriliruptorales bacterium]